MYHAFLCKLESFPPKYSVFAFMFSLEVLLTRIVCYLQLCSFLDDICRRMILMRRMSWMGLVALMEEMRNAHKILVVEHMGWRPL